MNIALLVILDIFAVGVLLSRSRSWNQRTLVLAFGYFFAFHLFIGLLMAGYEGLYVDPSFFRSAVNN